MKKAILITLAVLAAHGARLPAACRRRYTVLLAGGPESNKIHDLAHAATAATT